MPRCCCCCGNTNNDTNTGNAGANPVGTVIYAHVLQLGYVKANGQLLSRRDFPELYKYASENNLVLSESDWANEMQGMFAEGDGVNTFRVPDFRGQFLRALDDEAGVDVDRALGSAQRDAIRNITGTTMDALIPSIVPTTHTGAFSPTQLDDHAISHIANQTNAAYAYKSITSFDASRVVPTADENRPKNIALIAQIKY